MPWDPNTEKHMDDVLLHVKAYWKKHPHLRLGQLMVQVANFDPEWKEDCDVWTISDERLIRNILESM